MSGKIKVVAALALLVAACESVLTGPSAFLKVLQGAPEKIEMGGREFTLETFLWRDFMPMCPPEGRPLIAKTYVVASGEEEFPAWLDADYVWVINGEEVWEEQLTNERVPGKTNEFIRIARDGPLWKPLIRVDVVVRVVDAKGNEYLLRAADQVIHLTR